MSDLDRNWVQIWKNTLIMIAHWRAQRGKTDLPQTPIIVPLIVAGLFLGSIWSNKNFREVWKKAILAATISGVLNIGYVLALSLVNGQRDNLPPTGTALPTNPTTAGGPTFIVACGLTGFLAVIIVYLSTAAMIRYRRGRTIEPEQ